MADWPKLLHSNLRGLAQDDHHTYPVPTAGLATDAVTTPKIAAGAVGLSETGYNPAKFQTVEEVTRENLTKTASTLVCLTQNSAGSLEVSPVSSNISRPSDSQTDTRDGWAGIQIQPKVPIRELTLHRSGSTSGVTDYQILEGENGTAIKGPAAFTNGMTVSVNLQPGQIYHIQLYAGTKGYYGNFNFDSVETPEISLYGDSGPGGSPYNLLGVDYVTAGGKAVISPRSPTTRNWLEASAAYTPDGETVNWYVETSTDGGSTWSTFAGPNAGPVDLSGLSSSTLVRFRVEIEQWNTANNPSLDSVRRLYECEHVLKEGI